MGSVVLTVCSCHRRVGNWLGGVRCWSVDSRLPWDVPVRCAATWQPHGPSTCTRRHLSDSDHCRRSHCYRQLPRLLGSVHRERLLPGFCEYIFIPFTDVTMLYQSISFVCIMPDC